MGEPVFDQCGDPVKNVSGIGVLLLSRAPGAEAQQTHEAEKKRARYRTSILADRTFLAEAR